MRKTETPRAEKGPRPTISDVAALMGVSKSTVSRALNGRSRVSHETRARVLATLEEIGYAPSHAAISLSTGRTGLLGLVIGANRNPTALSAMQGAMTAAAPGGYGVVVYISSSDEEHESIYRNQLGSQAVDGVIHLFPRATDEPIIRRLQRRGTPVVIIDPQVRMADVPTIWSDSFNDGYICTRHLLKQGHSRIALCADVPGWGRQDRYADGYLFALKEAGIAVDPDLIARTGWAHAAGYQATSAWLDQARPPTAICYCCDTAALGGMSAARDRGLQLPRDLAIVGYDDTEVALWVTPSLTTLKDRRSDLARKACEMLIAHLSKAADAEEREVATTLAVRASSAAGASR
jgi:LacI family transcriptional regulator